jgi:hypothetical protein
MHVYGPAVPYDMNTKTRDDLTELPVHANSNEGVGYPLTLHVRTAISPLNRNNAPGLTDTPDGAARQGSILHGCRTNPNDKIEIFTWNDRQHKLNLGFG